MPHGRSLIANLPTQARGSNIDINPTPPQAQLIYLPAQQHKPSLHLDDRSSFGSSPPSASSASSHQLAFTSLLVVK
jgi:hypothetical protein